MISWSIHPPFPPRFLWTLINYGKKCDPIFDFLPFFQFSPTVSEWNASNGIISFLYEVKAVNGGMLN